MSNTLSRDALNDLKSRQIAFFHARLVSTEAASEWRANIEAAYGALLQRKLVDVASEEAVAKVLEAALALESFEKAIAPISSQIHAEVVAQLRKDEAPLGSYVPESARKKIDTFLERPGLVPERLVREVLEQDAMEETMRDVLFDALKQFNDTVNPFFAEWGLPGLIKRFLPIGSGAVLKSMEAVRGEFDKRLEPEMRKFLQGFSRKALKRMADFTVASSDEPKSIDVRKAIAAWLYEQPMKSLVANADASGLALTQEIGIEIAAHVAHLDVTRTQRREAIAKFFGLHATHTVAEVLAHHGVTAKPDFDALTALSWPLVRAVLESDPVRAWFAALVSEFFDGVEAA